jgi:predicted nucleic acid-binding protein
MRIVLDTNVFISGIFFSGPPSQILTAWKNSKFQIVLSQEILKEYRRVAVSLADKFTMIDILPIIDPNVAKVEGAADPRRQGCSCSNLPQTLDNAGDAVPSAFL